jgi:hypothetical protein
MRSSPTSTQQPARATWQAVRFCQGPDVHVSRDCGTSAWGCAAVMCVVGAGATRGAGSLLMLAVHSSTSANSAARDWELANGVSNAKLDLGTRGLAPALAALGCRGWSSLLLA